MIQSWLSAPDSISQPKPEVKPEKFYKPGERIEKSGIYRVIHEHNHTLDHEVTCIAGKPFPRCNGCPGVRFALKDHAIFVDSHDNFRR
jgi:hypothetical protein